MNQLRTAKKLAAEKLFDYALKLLSMRAISTGEVREKLRRKAERLEDVEGIISKLRESGYLNDALFAEGYASGRRDGQGFGRSRVLRDLRTRRVAPNVAEKAVADAFAETNETEMIEAFLARKLRNVSLPEHLKDEKNLRSVYRKLRYAGFSVGPTIAVLKRHAARAAELEYDEDEEA